MNCIPKTRKTYKYYEDLKKSPRGKVVPFKEVSDEGLDFITDYVVFLEQRYNDDNFVDHLFQKTKKLAQVAKDYNDDHGFMSEADYQDLKLHGCPIDAIIQEERLGSRCSIRRHLPYAIGRSFTCDSLPGEKKNLEDAANKGCFPWPLKRTQQAVCRMQGLSQEQLEESREKVQLEPLCNTIGCGMKDVIKNFTEEEKNLKKCPEIDTVDVHHLYMDRKLKEILGKPDNASRFDKVMAIDGFAALTHSSGSILEYPAFDKSRMDYNPWVDEIGRVIIDALDCLGGADWDEL